MIVSIIVCKSPSHNIQASELHLKDSFLVQEAKVLLVVFVLELTLKKF